MTAPYIPLYVDDFEGATSHLSLEEDGAYNRLLRLCWRTAGCSVPADPAWIARKMRATPEAYDRVIAPIIAEFFTTKSGRVFQKRLREEWSKYDATKRKRAQAGKKGGVARALNNNENVSSPATRLLKQPKPEPEPEPLRETNVSPPAFALEGEPVRGKVSRRRPETAIPAKFPDEAAIAAAAATFEAAGIKRSAQLTADQFRNHALQNDRRARDWAAAFRNWVSKTVERAQGEAPKAAKRVTFV